MRQSTTDRKRLHLHVQYCDHESVRSSVQSTREGQRTGPWWPKATEQLLPADMLGETHAAGNRRSWPVSQRPENFCGRNEIRQ